MIGHYLGTLTQEQEDRVLTSRLAQAPCFVRADGCRCLVGVAEDMGWQARGFPRSGIARDIGKVGIRFDCLCERFGEPRINSAIRNRILSNRANRALAGVRELVETA